MAVHLGWFHCFQSALKKKGTKTKKIAYLHTNTNTWDKFTHKHFQNERFKLQNMYQESLEERES